MLDLRQGMIAGNHVDSGDPYVITNGYSSNSFRNEFGPRRKTRNCYSSDDLGVIEFESKADMEDDSGISSPPLWKISPTTVAATNKESFPFLHFYHHHHINPTLRSAEIERGRQELMGMMQGVPESAYELSLKDLVEMPMVGLRQEKRTPQDESENEIKKKKRDKRRGSTENRGLLLKMFFPSVLGSKKWSSKGGRARRVSPRSVSPEGVDEELWKRNEHSETSRSSSYINSSNQRGHGSRNMGGLIPGCWSFFHTKKSKTMGRKGILT